MPLGSSVFPLEIKNASLAFRMLSLCEVMSSQPRPQASLPGRAWCTLRYGIDNSRIAWRCGTVANEIKIHKAYDRLPKFRPIIDTTGTTH